MGWSVGYDSTWKRDIGYGVPSICDHPGCNEKIDRGLSYVCGGEPHGGDDGCGLYFCTAHGGGSLCARCDCVIPAPPFDMKPDTPAWVAWKLDHESWAQWRKKHPEQVQALRRIRGEQ